MKALEHTLEQEKYFYLYLELAREAETALARNLEFVESEEASSDERSYVSHEPAELALTYRDLLSRLEASEQWFQSAAGRSRSSLRLAQMSRDTASATQKLMGQLRSLVDASRAGSVR
jgi:hypothetical protein